MRQIVRQREMRQESNLLKSAREFSVEPPTHPQVTTKAAWDSRMRHSVAGAKESRSLGIVGQARLDVRDIRSMGSAHEEHRLRTSRDVGP